MEHLQAVGVFFWEVCGLCLHWHGSVAEGCLPGAACAVCYRVLVCTAPMLAHLMRSSKYLLSYSRSCQLSCSPHVLLLAGLCICCRCACGRS